MRQARSSPDPDGQFYNRVEQANAMSLPKAARFEWFICSGASARILHVWLELVREKREEGLSVAEAVFFSPGQRGGKGERLVHRLCTTAADVARASAV